MISSTSDWMGNLPLRLQTKPLVNLCIPGSHDSFTCKLNANGPVGNDQPTWLRVLARICPTIKRVIYNWSRCQDACVGDQLEMGVRYLDVRLCRLSGSNKIRTIHGLCGQRLDSLLYEIRTFLEKHPRELILLDFNHFYGMNDDDHVRTIRAVLMEFGDRCCPTVPFVDLRTLDLRTCWSNGWRIVVFYQVCFDRIERAARGSMAESCLVDSSHVPLRYHIWNKDFIRSPWPNTDRPDRMIEYLECSLRRKEQILPRGGFLVTQGILTPQTNDVILRPFSTFRDRMGAKTVPILIDWLETRGSAIKKDMNVIMTDFVQVDEFCRKVIAMNF